MCAFTWRNRISKDVHFVLTTVTLRKNVDPFQNVSWGDIRDIAVYFLAGTPLIRLLKTIRQLMTGFALLGVKK
ncbi:hypothetical protein CSKR_111996 [Clonorchis sinensis]|uniref:Uncharacterized protein n=1 Tax=Clonorchis sinensis TaxID=79923 RepID=A0A419Q5U4_CLOSI|nr:hypothetical protein CSKR_111996 [Clonorchis sinensis]